MAQADKITALYCRFSYDDGTGESDSVAHQKAILSEYANSHGLPNQRFYIDDGVSGTTFDRNGFQAMLHDIENGLVGTVVVKDMSRFGRNYLMVGQYLEIVFPEHNVRFIAISDNVDSDKGINDMIPFHNIINEWYARDISRKVRTVIQNKGNNGEHTTAKAIYGYKKDPNDKTKWIIDEPAAKIVRRIFDMFTSGMGVNEISRILTNEKIPKPTTYLGYRLGVHCDDFEEYFWQYSTIRLILRHQEYCGDTVNFRTSRVSYKLHKKVFNPKEKLKIFYNTHEAIVSREQFEEVQKIFRDKKRKVPATKERSTYYGFLFCDACKHTMRINRTKINSKENGTYIRKIYFCSLLSKKPDACSSHIIYESILDAYVIEQINRLLMFAKSDRKNFDRMLYERCAGNALAELEANNAEIECIKNRIAEIDKFMQGLFESKIKGEIDGDMFCTFSENYHNEKEECVKFIGENSAYRIYCDDGKSGKDIQHRPAFQEMMQDARDGIISRIVVKKYDRFSSNMREYLNITDELDKLGVSVYSLSEPFNTETKEGRMMRNNLLNFAEFERETIAARVADAFQTKACETGFYQGGKVQFGYATERRKIRSFTQRYYQIFL